jgi:hypothetical protein
VTFGGDFGIALLYCMESGRYGCVLDSGRVRYLFVLVPVIEISVNCRDPSSKFQDRNFKKFQEISRATLEISNGGTGLHTTICIVGIDRSRVAALVQLTCLSQMSFSHTAVDYGTFLFRNGTTDLAALHSKLWGTFISMYLGARSDGIRSGEVSPPLTQTKRHARGKRVAQG